MLGGGGNTHMLKFVMHLSVDPSFVLVCHQMHSLFKCYTPNFDFRIIIGTLFLFCFVFYINFSLKSDLNQFWKDSNFFKNVLNCLNFVHFYTQWPFFFGPVTRAHKELFAGNCYWWTLDLMHWSVHPFTFLCKCPPPNRDHIHHS